MAGFPSTRTCGEKRQNTYPVIQSLLCMYVCMCVCTIIGMCKMSVCKSGSVTNGIAHMCVYMCVYMCVLVLVWLSDHCPSLVCLI